MRILITVLALLCTAGVTGTTPAVASVSPIASFSATPGGSVGVYASRAYAQVFIAGSSSVPGDLTLVMSSSRVNADLTVTIREWDSGNSAPTGGTYAMYRQPDTSPISSMSEVTLTASAAAQLTGGSTYALVFESNTTIDNSSMFPMETEWSVLVSSFTSYQRLFRQDSVSWNPNAYDAVLFTLAAEPSTDSTLTNLACTTCTLDTAFASGTTNYTSTVANNVSNVTITPTTTDSNATVTINGTTVTSGTPSNPINLTVGTNTITVLVTAQDTSTTTYTLTITRSPSTDSTLSSLTCTTCTLDTTFTSGTTSYASTVANNVSNVTITPTTTDSAATVTVNGTTVTSGTPSNPINLTVGTNTITVLVTAQDTSTTAYTVQIRRRSAPASGQDSGDLAAPVREVTPTARPTSPTAQPPLVSPIDDADMSLPPPNPPVAIAPARYFRVTSAAVAEAAPIRHMRKPGTPRLGPAPRITSEPDAPIRLQVAKMAREQTYTVLVRRPGMKYVTVGQVEPWQDGTLALPVISFKKRGLYILVVTDEAKAARYIKIRVS